MSNQQAFRVGVVGVGHLGKVHARLWKSVEGAVLVGVYDEIAESAQAIAEELQVPAFTHLEELIEAVNGLSIVTPTYAHYQVAQRAIMKGRHVLIEKPITTTVREAEDLIALANEHNVKIQVGHIERFNPALLAAEKYLNAPRFFESHRMAQFKPRGTDVPVVLDLMVHDIDVILSLVKSPVVSIDASGIAVVSEQIDIANARIKFANGAVANVTSSRISQNPMRKLRIFQRDAYLSIDFATKTSEIFRILGEGEENISPQLFKLGEIERADVPRAIVYERPKADDINPLKYELELFRDAVLLDRRPIVSGEDGLEALRVAEQILASIEHQSL